jgi:hypothetical protein
MGGAWWVLFAARRLDRELAVGLAKGPSPNGPFTAAPEPLLGGGVIDPHLFVDGDHRLLFWKEDANGVWPRRLAALLAADPALAEALFEAEPDRRTAAFAGAVWPWAQTREPMEQFFVLQPLIEAVTADYGAFASRLAGRTRARPGEARALEAVMAALKTRIFAQPLSADGLRLEGEPVVVMQNDQAWEAARRSPTIRSAPGARPGPCCARAATGSAPAIRRWLRGPTASPGCSCTPTGRDRWATRRSAPCSARACGLAPTDRRWLETEREAYCCRMPITVAWTPQVSMKLRGSVGISSGSALAAVRRCSSASRAAAIWADACAPSASATVIGGCFPILGEVFTAARLFTRTVSTGVRRQGSTGPGSVSGS